MCDIAQCVLSLWDGLGICGGLWDRALAAFGVWWCGGKAPALDPNGLGICGALGSSSGGAWCLVVWRQKRRHWIPMASGALGSSSGGFLVSGGVAAKRRHWIPMVSGALGSSAGGFLVFGGVAAKRRHWIPMVSGL